MNVTRPTQFGSQLRQTGQKPLKFGEIGSYDFRQFANHFDPLKLEHSMNSTQLTQILDAGKAMVDRICQAYESRRGNL